jgi:hypothetical protein
MAKEVRCVFLPGFDSQRFRKSVLVGSIESACRKTGLVNESSPCLSRACLGKMIVFMYTSGVKRTVSAHHVQVLPHARDEESVGRVVDAVRLH